MSAPKLARLVIKKAAPKAQAPPAKKTKARKAAAKTVAPVKQAALHDTPVHRFVVGLREQHGVHYRTTQEVADEIGVSTQWVRKIQRGSTLDVPSLITRYGDIKIYLYTPEDMDKIRKHLAERQQVYLNPGTNTTIASWEDVKKRREQPQENAHRQDDRNEPSSDVDSDGSATTGEPAGDRTGDGAG